MTTLQADIQVIANALDELRNASQAWDLVSPYEYAERATQEHAEEMARSALARIRSAVESRPVRCGECRGLLRPV